MSLYVGGVETVLVVMNDIVHIKIVYDHAVVSPSFSEYIDK